MSLNLNLSLSLNYNLIILCDLFFLMSTDEVAFWLELKLVMRIKGGDDVFAVVVVVPVTEMHG